MSYPRITDDVRINPSHCLLSIASFPYSFYFIGLTVTIFTDQPTHLYPNALHCIIKMSHMQRL